MSNILKNYTNIFNLIIKASFAGPEGKSDAYKAVEKVQESGDFISNQEWAVLREKYTKKDLAAALSSVSVSAGEEVTDAIIKLIDDVNNGIDAVTVETTENLTEHKGYIEIEDEVTDYTSNTESVTRSNEITSSNPFTRTLRKGVRDTDTLNDVTALQEFLNAQGYDTNGIDGDFGPGTFKALKKFQKEVLGFSRPDGRMDLNGQTMNYIVDNNYSSVSTSEVISSRDLEGDALYGREANDLIGDLGEVDRYLTAFNKVYGGTEDIISRHNGLLGIVNHLGQSDLDRLAAELNICFECLEDQDAFAAELGIDKNSTKYKNGLIRTAVIAAVGAALSGGSNLVLELFAINYGEHLSQGPAMSTILSNLGHGQINVQGKMRDVLISGETTVAGLNAILDILNNPNMDTANLKRFMKEVYQPNWFQDTFGILLPNGYEEVENLIAVFEQTSTTQNAKAAVKAIYELAHQAHDQAEIDYSNAYNEYASLSPDIISDASSPAAETNSFNSPDIVEYDNNEYTDAVHAATFVIRRLNDTQLSLEKATQGLGHLGQVASRYGNLDAKRAQIEGDVFDISSARAEETNIDAQLGASNLITTSEKLHSAQSFGFHVDVNQVQDTNYMSNLVERMRTETINGETSVLAGVIRGLNQHYNVNISPEEFISAFTYTAEATTSDYVLSNLGRERNQKFQGDLGKLGGNLFKINVNGQEFYFKDSCTNIVTVAQPLLTTVESTSSIPVVVTVNIGGKGGDTVAKDDGKLESEPGEIEQPIPGSPANNPGLPTPPPAAPGNTVPLSAPTDGEGFTFD